MRNGSRREDIRAHLQITAPPGIKHHRGDHHLYSITVHSASPMITVSMNARNMIQETPIGNTFKIKDGVATAYAQDTDGKLVSRKADAQWIVGELTSMFLFSAVSIMDNDN